VKGLEFLRFVIDYFSMSHGKVPKILVQKSLYFLNTQGIETGYCFAGDVFGPYSASVAYDACDLEMNGEVCIEHAFYIKDARFTNTYSFDTSLVQEKLDFFCSAILKNDFSFKNVNLTGTVLYVMQSLRFPSVQDVCDKVVQWKGDTAHNVQDVVAMYAHLTSLLGEITSSSLKTDTSLVVNFPAT
jgi:hypothetical protein